MLSNINFLSHAVNQSFLDDSSQNFDSALISTGLIAIAALATPLLIQVGLHLNQRWDAYKQKFMMPPESLVELKDEAVISSEELIGETDFSEELNKGSALPLQPKEVFEKSSPVLSLVSPRANVLEGISVREMTPQEAREKYSQMTEEHKKMSLEIEGIKTTLKKTPKYGASRDSLSLQLKKCREEEKTLDTNIKLAYRKGYGEAIEAHAKSRKINF